MRRRDFLKLGLWGAASCLGAKTPVRAQTHGGGHNPLAFSGTHPYVPYRDPLPIPPVLKPKRRGRVDTYTITMKEGMAQCHSQLPPTPILGYNGLYPGPVIRATRGRPVEITHVNQLPSSHVMHSPSIHLHGALVAPEHDGHPNDGIPAGGSRAYVYPNQQRACPLWYHDHTHEATGERVYRGLAGLYFVDDPKDAGLRLPKGNFEIPLVIQDRSFLPTGELFYDTSDATLETGFHGDVILTNGVVQPYLNVSTRKYRFRILNGSNSRIYKLAVSNGQSLIQIGTDGGLLHRPIAKSSIEIAPSERVDVVIDFANLEIGSSLLLLNKNDFGRLGAIMRFDIVKQERDTALVPPFLTPWEDLPEAAAVTTRDFTLNRKTVGDTFRWVINGQTYDPANAPLATPKLGTLERWRFINPTNHPHPMHMHLVQFQVVNIGGEPQDASQHGWKDTVLVPPGSEVTVLARFEGYTGRYVFHCHNLEHEDFAMMAEFEVQP
jgi:spore coat protein A, manganese oxidase